MFCTQIVLKVLNRAKIVLIYNVENQKNKRKKTTKVQTHTFFYLFYIGVLFKEKEIKKKNNIYMSSWLSF